MNATLFDRTLARCLEELRRREAAWPAFADPPAAADDPEAIDPARLEGALEEFFARLSDTYPFFHDRYAGQMLKPPHAIAQLGYIAAMRLNPNNHALDGGPATTHMEREVIAEIAALFDWPGHIGHLTGGGTIANLEALWVARERGKGRAVAASASAHYTHGRMCKLLGVPFVEIDVDLTGRMDVADLARKLDRGDIGLVVGTLGTTGLGAIDPLDEILAEADRHDAWVHVDAAYGGFYRLVADGGPTGVRREPFEAAARAASLVVDPHKHGLQPYGCGSVLFRDPSVAVHYLHDSPYTYFTSSEQHLGEISLECSRAGAAAAAFWLTLRCFPLRAHEGLGAVLRACRRAALSWAERIRSSNELVLVADPELDIVAYAPRTKPFSATAVSRATAAVLETAMTDVSNPVFLSKLRVKSRLLERRFPDFAADEPSTTVLRSCLLKPSHARAVDALHEVVLHHVRSVLGGGASRSRSE